MGKIRNPLNDVKSPGADLGFDKIRERSKKYSAIGDLAIKIKSKLYPHINVRLDKNNRIIK